MFADNELNPLILTIDDEPAIRRSFKDFLEDSDFVVIEAENGAVGIDLVAEKTPDLILLDLSMPEMDGFEVLNHLKKTTPHTPIIVVSGIGVIKDAVKALKLGAWDYLLKPVEDLNMLQHSVEKCLERARLIRENEAYQENLEKEVLRRTRQLDEANRELHEINIKLRSSENKFRTLADTSPMAILMIEDLKPVYINRNAQSLLGYTLQEMLEIDLTDLICEEMQQESLEKFARFNREKPAHARDVFKIVTKDGTERWIDVSGGFTELEGRKSGILSFIDISDRKAYEDTLENLNRELEKRVSRRTAELEAANKELIEAKHKADEATEAKSSFLANMSHEIRTPMNGVIAAVELALQEEAPPKIDRLLNIIQSSGYSLLEIINDILDFSKIEAGKLNLEITSFYLSDLLHDTANPFISSAFNKKIDLLIDVDTKSNFRYLGDRLRIKQVLSNLLSNAIKFTGELGTITIGVQQEDAGTTDEISLLFSVKDTGIGMSQAEQLKIFQPFTQADISTTRKFGGTGLGLSISKKLVELMGGEIWVESSKESGTAFYFSVTVQIDDTAAAREFSLDDDLSRLHILVLDDNPHSRGQLEKILEAFGCQVSSFYSDEEAVQYLRQSPAGKADLLIVDDYIPGLNGWDSYQTLKTKPESLPVIIMSGVGQQWEDQNPLHSAHTAILHKPFSPSTVFDALMMALKGTEAIHSLTRKDHQVAVADYQQLLGGIRILVAEDNATNQEIVQAILEKTGIDVVMVDNGQDALDAMMRETFDAVLMDVQMPVMDGFQATKQIREQDDFKTLPIIAMTAHAMKGDEEQCLDIGMNAYISKPINQSKLFQTLANCIHKENYIDTATAGTSTSDATEVSAHLRIDGLDVAQALRNLSVDESTYTRILKRFYLHHQPLLQQLRSCFEAGNWSELKKLSHSFHGSTNNIGAYQTGQHASALELALDAENGADDMEKIAPLFQAFYQSIHTLLTALETFASEDPDPEEIQAISASERTTLKNLLSELSSALERMDPKQIKQILTRMRASCGHPQLKRIEQLVEMYEFDEALALIQQIAQ